MYEDILFPTDGSESANAAFEHAVDLATTYDATLHVFYVVNTTYKDLGASGKRSINSLREAGSSVVEETVDRAESAGVDVVEGIEEGDPYQEILEYSEGVDLVVMGTRGRTGVDRYLLGSVTEKVVRTADAAVLTVRNRPE